MSRLRRADLHSRFFFVTTNLLRGERVFSGAEFEVMATSLDRLRGRIPFALCAYCFMPDHVHAIVFPEERTTISDVMKRFKLGTFRRLRISGQRSRPFWQSRFHDHALRTRGELDETLEYIHMNPVRKGLVREPQAWRWSSASWFTAGSGPIAMDEVRLPNAASARI